MATRVSDSEETDDYYAVQAALGVAVASAVRELWPALDPADIAGTFPDLRVAASSIGARHSLAAVSLAADYYEDHRLAQGVETSFRVPIIEAPVPAQFEAYIEKSTADLLAEVDRVTDELLYAELSTQLQAELEGSVTKVVGDAGRNELLAAIEGDRRARGWARVTRPNACSFCRMLAARGAVYKSQRSGNFRAHVPIDGRGGTCQCTVQPLFADSYEPPAHTRADQALWERVTEGRTGRDALNEFRRHVEGRADGRRIERDRDREPEVKAPKGAAPLGFDSLTPTQLRHQLAVVEGLPDSEYRTAQLERLRTRLAEIGI